nr:hypothetical protein [Tanacetum cinerariifolium]
AHAPHVGQARGVGAAAHGVAAQVLWHHHFGKGGRGHRHHAAERPVAVAGGAAGPAVGGENAEGIPAPIGKAR